MLKKQMGFLRKVIRWEKRLLGKIIGTFDKSKMRGEPVEKVNRFSPDFIKDNLGKKTFNVIPLDSE